MQNDHEPNETTERGNDHCEESERLTKRDLIGAVSLLVVVFGIVVGYYTYNYISKDSVRMQFWITCMFSFTGLIIVTLQVVIYAQQARFMRQQVDVTRIAERGYIGIERANLLNGLAIGEKPTVCIFFRNGGRTPIWNMMHPTRITIGTIFPAGRPKQYRAEGTGFLPAGLTRDVEYILVKPVTQEFIDDITDGRIKIFINGESHFRDCWNEKRIEPFKLVYVPRLERFAEYFAHAEDFQEQDGSWSLPVRSRTHEADGTDKPKSQPN